MAKFTRQAIMYSTLKLLQIKPIDKITVRDICDQCELTRNTFYYYSGQPRGQIPAEIFSSPGA